MSIIDKPRYAVGTQYKTRGKNPRICTVTDILRTYNSKNELVKIRYVSTHDFLGQKVTDSDVVGATIAMGFIDPNELRYPLVCAMLKDCDRPVTHLDRKGYVYCEICSKLRRYSVGCRKLTSKEIKILESGKPLEKYERA